MISVFSCLNILSYLVIILYLYKIQDQLNFNYNFLVISCSISLGYYVIIFIQSVNPIFTNRQILIKEYLMNIQILYLLCFFKKLNFFSKQKFEKIFNLITHLYKAIFLIIPIAIYSIPYDPFTSTFIIIDRFLGIQLFIIFLLYIIPSIYNKENNYSRELKLLILSFSLLLLLHLTSLFFNIRVSTFDSSKFILNIIFNIQIFIYVSINKGRYLSD